MAADGRATSRVLAIVLIVVLAIAVAVLAVYALQRVDSAGDPVEAGPVPTFTLGVQTGEPTPSPSSAPVSDRASDRFLSVGSAALWRATAGTCNGAEPLVERSVDGGATWTDVTPRYRGIAQVMSLDAFADTEAEMVTALTGCEAHALRTYTQGAFWDSYPDVLAASRYLSDGATVVTPAGVIAAPCTSARGLRAAGDVLALVCDRVAYSLVGPDWVALPAADVAAVAVSGTDVVVAHARGDACAGVAFTRFPAGGAEAGTFAGCAEGADASSPAAIAASGDAFLLWTADALVPVGP